MSVKEQRETERRTKALDKITKLYREWMRACGESDKDYAYTKAAGYQYMTAIEIYVTLTGEEEYTVIEYVSNHFTEE